MTFVCRLSSVHERSYEDHERQRHREKSSMVRSNELEYFILFFIMIIYLAVV
jgi:hypothetical protein